jgi:YD repeat-containing protein
VTGDASNNLLISASGGQISPGLNSTLNVFGTYGTYDSAGGLTNEALSDGTPASYVYDSQGNLTTATAAGGTVAHYTYDVNGQVASCTLPDGTVTHYGYAANGRITEILSRNADGSVASHHQHRYCANGPLIAEETSDGNWTCSNDASDELTNAGSIVVSTLALASGRSADKMSGLGTVSLTDGEFAFSFAAGNTLEVAASGGDPQLLCFCADTRILTPSGERAVQDLAVGDLVTTQRGEARPIVWIGRVLATPGRRSAATPVIVRKSALADNVPNHDLRLTKDHALYLDRVLIPVEFLLNHRSILWDDHMREVTLYHVELESHDVLIANGALAESYRDDGNRWLFPNANSGWKLPPQEPCAPVLTGGPVVDAIWLRLLDRVGPRPGAPLTDDPDVHLLADGRRIDPTLRSYTAYTFRLSRRPRALRIASRAAVPQELGLARDPRMLGVALHSIRACQGNHAAVVDAQDETLTEGFHTFEPANAFRWTDGNAAVPDKLLAGLGAPIELTLHVGCVSKYPLGRDEQRVA